MLPKNQRVIWKKLRAVNREVTESLVQALQAAAPVQTLAAIQTGGVELGHQWTGPHLSEAVGHPSPPREAVRSSLLLLGWHQLLQVQDADDAQWEALERGELNPALLPYSVETRREEVIVNYVAQTGADRELIEEATTLFLKLAHGDEIAWYPRWKYQAVRGLLSSNPQWRDDGDFVEVMMGATFASLMAREMTALFNHLTSLPNPVVASTTEPAALAQYSLAFRESPYGKSQHSATLDSVAKFMGVSKERVRQIEEGR